MRKLLFVSISLILITFIIQSCDESSTTNPTVELKVAFPNSIGSYWVYEVFDSVRTTYDTVRVSITDTVTLPGISKHATEWTYESKTLYPAMVYQSPKLYFVFPDSIKSKNDTIFVYQIVFDTVSWLNDIYVMPFDSGSYWLFGLYSLFPDSSMVIEIADITNQAGKFTNSAHISELYNCGDECGGSYEYWFKNGVGFVKTIRKEYDLMEPYREIHAIWNLIEYHIE